MTKKIKLSVVSITYNQESFVKDAVEGFLKQKVNFPWEIIIADDASTDKTAQIIKEYSEKNPGLIKPILRTKNVGVLDNLYDALRTAKGEYIAICEGDDYWTDENKLQKQVDFLEQNAEYSMCFHSVKVVYENKEKKDAVYPDTTKKRNFDIFELLKNNFIQTNSVVYRKQDYGNLPENIMPIDWYLHLYHAQFGKIGFINETMSVYRRHSGGIWWDSRDQSAKMKLWEKYGIPHLQLFAEILKLIRNDKKKEEILSQTIGRTLSEFTDFNQRDNEKIVETVIKKFPSFIEPYLRFESTRYIEQKAIADERKAEIKQLNKKLEEKESAIERRNQEIERIKSTKTWKARTAAAKFLKKS